MASKKMGAFRMAGEEMDKFFSDAQNQGSEAIKTVAEENPKPTNKKASQEDQKPQKKVFSFRAETEAVDSWRLYADAKGVKVDDLGEKALKEYIRKHPLTEDQQKIYDLKKAQKKS